MILYIFPKCSSCKEALKFLKEHAIEVEVKNIVETPPTVKELKQMLTLQNGQLKKLFNSSGILYKEMNLSFKLADMSESEALELLHQHGMLVKRPFLLGKGIGLLGFKEIEWEQLK